MSDSGDNHFTFLVRSEEKAEQIKAQMPSADVVCGSLEEKELLANALKGQDILLHIAGIQKSLDLVELAIEAGVKWLILVHTTGVYSKYKAAGEGYRQIDKKIREMIYGKDIALTILRPTMIYGNLDDGNVSVFMKMVYKLRWMPVVDHAKYELQPVWCRDLGKAYYQVLMNQDVTKDKDYVLSGGAPIKLIDMFKTMGRLQGVKNHFVNVPFWLAYSGAWIGYILSFGKIDFREKVQRLVEPRVYGHEAATNDFGYNPVRFEEGVVDEVKMFLERESHRK